MSGVIGDSAPSLSNLSKRVGETVARQLFKARGNHSEVHLNELELALVCASAAEVAQRLPRAQARDLTLRERLHDPRG